MEFLAEAEFWVGVGVVIFLGILLVAGVPKLVFRKLDEKSGAIQSELDEARRIREEAESMLAQLKAQRAEAERNAADLLKAAEAEAGRLAAEAAAKLEESLARRQALADRRISQAEANAEAEIKAAVVDVAARLAENVLMARAQGRKTDPSVDAAVQDLGVKLQ